MARSTPRVAGSVLVGRDATAPDITVGSPAWYAWLEAASTFVFTSAQGGFSARKERGGRTGWYWKAYRKQAGRLYRAYLGKSSDLSLDRLTTVATEVSRRATGPPPAASVRMLRLGVPADGPPPATVEGQPAPSSPALPTLLATKLYIPTPRAQLVPRPRLIARLDRALEHGHKLTLICAPAGAGKTTLLTDWLATADARGTMDEQADGRSGQPAAFRLQRSRTAWVSLDTDDNDPIRFWTYVIGALALVAPRLLAPVRAVLATPPLPPLEVLLTLLINALADRAPLDGPIVLVLDDYHLIATAAIHDSLLRLIDHLPPQLHLVLTSRADPPLPLARLRARGELAELRTPDLRFTPDEATTFLTAAMGLALTPAEIATLEARTEGWITGLHLAALALRARGDPGDFVAAFAQSNHFVVDYLMDEVFRQQPAHIQTFLLQTAILNRFCGSLCDAVVGLRPDESPGVPGANMVAGVDDPGSGGEAYSQLILSQLEHANLFIVPLDADRRWYRYHHLFADALRERLRAGARHDDLATLHRRAARWFEQQGLIPEAVQHAQASHDWDHSAKLIVGEGAALLEHGETATILRWLETLPPDQVRVRPRLCLLYAWALIGSRSDPAAAVAPWVEAILQREPAGDTITAELYGEAFAVKATIATMQEDIASTIAFAHEALARLPQESRWQSQIRLSLGLAYTLAGDITAAHLALTEAARLSRKNNAWHLVFIAESFLADLRALQGQLDQALTGYHQVLQQAADRPGAQRGAALAHGGLGNVLLERNRLEAASSHLQASTDLYRLIGGTVRRGLVNAVALARVKQAQGDWHGAYAVLGEIHDRARQAQILQLVRHIAAWQARLQLAQGQLDAAVRWADASGLDVDDPDLPFHREVEYLTLARVRSAQGLTASAEHLVRAALRLLDRLLAAAEADGRLGSAIEILAVQAVARAAHGDRAHAQRVLARALALAEPEGYVRTFVDEGADMAALVSAIATGDTPVARYAAALLEAFPPTHRNTLLPPTLRHEVQVSSDAATEAPPHHLLTAREREVLRLLAAGRTNPQIAAQLVIGAGTVKTHTLHIYRKLEVANRTQAIVRAQELGLLGS